MMLIPGKVPVYIPITGGAGPIGPVGPAPEMPPFMALVPGLGICLIFAYLAYKVWRYR